MQMASSAKRTCKELRSASLYTATVLMPSSLQAQITRNAISPRFAIRIFLNIYLFGWTNRKKWFAIFHTLTAAHQPLHNFAAYVGFNLVHQLAGPDDATPVAVLHRVAGRHTGRRSGGGRLVDRANDGSLNRVQLFFSSRRSLRMRCRYRGRGDMNLRNPYGWSNRGN